jgi:hypothetical protein
MIAGRWGDLSGLQVAPASPSSRWGAAGIYPTAASPQLAITSQQAAQLTPFAA